MRHGESCWNKLNIFTGWVDIPLSQKGIEEALEGGKRIQNIPIDIIFTSTLVRAQMTTFLAMSQHKSGKVPVVMHPEDHKLNQWGKIYGEEAKANTIPVFYSWELNERMYGKLQGLNKADTKKKFGEEQFMLWRRSYETPPPHGESLEMTAERALPYFNKMIVPHLVQGKNVFVSAHGNSLRAICMFLDDLSHEEVVKLEIPTGQPIIYDFSHNKFKKE
jgi:2,3-bisphosphoglycerate-dependent phosphoglycerate mutase